MTTIRRIYAYLLAFFGLAMFSIAAANLAQLLVDLALQSPLTDNGGYVRDTVALYAAMALVGLPAWLLHWLWIERTARSNRAERASVLRRLFVYAVLGSAMLVMAVSAADILARLVDALMSARGADSGPDDVVRRLPFTLIAFGVWWAHLRVAAADRALVGEHDGSATLRRWYVYGAAFIGLLVLLHGAQSLLEAIWLMAVQTAGIQTSAGRLPGAVLGGPIAAALVGLAVWLGHWVTLPARLPESARRDDGVSALRSVYLFLGLAVAVVGSLLGASQLLYYAVGRLLGVAEPGGVGGNILLAAAGPGSFVIVFGAAWAYQRAAVRQQSAMESEAPRQAGVRRLYAYLVALLALVVLATGIAGLLWTFGDLVFDATAAAAGDTWREQISLFATLALVGLPAWLLHWRPSPADAPEAHSLARRLYVYLSLIAAALIGIASLAAALYRLISLALGERFDQSVSTDLAHALAIASVAALLGAYHWRILRADASRLPTGSPEASTRHGASALPPAVTPSAAAAASSAAAPAPSSAAAPVAASVVAVVTISAADAASLARALDTLRATGVQVTVVTPPPAGVPTPTGSAHGV